VKNVVDLFESQILNKYSVITVRSYLHAIRQFEKWLGEAGTNLSDYARSDVQQYVDSLLSKKLSASTIHRVFNAIKIFSVWCQKSEATEDIRMPKQKNYILEAPKSLERNKLNELIRSIERSGNKRNFAIALTMLYTGIRVSECAALDRSDINMSERKGTLIVRNGKGSKERKIPLHAEVRRAISKYLETRIDNNPALFISNRTRRISVRSLQTIFESYGINAHKCRHTFITSLLREGKDVALIQSFTGHSSINMIGRYGKASEEDKQKAIDSLFLKG
jgi:integrase/recombinase XerC/integrase/recombinase XerD